MQPLVFEPYLRPQIWGQRRLERSLGKVLPGEGGFGESWEISAHPHHISRVAEGPVAGARLDVLWSRHARDVTGRSDVGERYPWLIKFLDCHEQLSVQVHPNDEIAHELLGNEMGKTEAWVVLDSGPAGRIQAGLKPGVTQADLVRHLDAGTVGECLHSFAPRTGDCVFLPAGTVHAVGGGVLLAEVQQTSDATFRLFDWNRLGPDGKPRTLHRSQAQRSIDWSAGPVAPVTPQPLAGLSAGVLGQRLVTCPYFRIDRYRISAGASLRFPGCMWVWMVIEGHAELRTGDGTYQRAFRLGETVLVPASAGEICWTAPASATLLAVTEPH